MNSLGSNGRLGNQMFQYASLRGIAENNGHDFCIPPSIELNPYYDHMLFKFFEMPNAEVGIGSGRTLTEGEGFRFDSSIFFNCPDNVDLFGYFQSHRYFDHIRNPLLEDFKIKEEYMVDNFCDVSIHVRRGDYVDKTQFHGLMSENYYRRAMGIFPSKSKFMVFSDDIEWCKAQEVFSGCEFWEGRNEGEDFYLMSTARIGSIVANSSFSWWGAWLNQNEGLSVVAPIEWFNPSYISIDDTKDLIPSEWIRL